MKVCTVVYRARSVISCSNNGRNLVGTPVSCQVYQIMQNEKPPRRIVPEYESAPLCTDVASSGLVCNAFVQGRGQMCYTKDETSRHNDLVGQASHSQPVPGSIEDLHKKACLEGGMFYVDPESGYNVMTEVAHLKRGKCCGNTCRHCPFDHVNVKKRQNRGTKT